MKKQDPRLQKHFFFRVIVTFLFALLVSQGCNKHFLSTEYTTPPYPEIPKDTSIILWKNPDASDADFELWKQNHHLPSPREINLCPFCSSDKLELFDGVGMDVFAQGGSGGTPCTTCKPSGGGDDTAYYCYDFPINLDTAFFEGQTVDSIMYNPNKRARIILQNTPQPGSFVIPSQDASTGPVVNIAVFDTGIDPAITTRYTTPLPAACNGAAASGWNFAGNNANTADDYPGRHGTTVTEFIIDQATTYHNQKINIIPVKIFDSRGTCSMSNILCGFAFASNSGIQIINASFGFYWHDLDNPPSLFTAFVKNYLTKKGILLIAAAGNRMEGEDREVVNAGTVTQANLRNLKKHPFYPAQLAGRKGFGNVIAVTTVFTPAPYDKVSPQQNCAQKIVDIGVNGDAHYLVKLPDPKDEFGFIDPLGRQRGGLPLVISGSSYATPIITGKIAAYYNTLVSGMGTTISKSTLRSRLSSQGMIQQSPGPGIRSQVRKGMYATK